MINENTYHEHVEYQYPIEMTNTLIKNEDTIAFDNWFDPEWEISNNIAAKNLQNDNRRLQYINKKLTAMLKSAKTEIHQAIKETVEKKNQQATLQLENHKEIDDLKSKLAIKNASYDALDKNYKDLSRSYQEVLNKQTLNTNKILDDKYNPNSKYYQLEAKYDDLELELKQKTLELDRLKKNKLDQTIFNQSRTQNNEIPYEYSYTIGNNIDMIKKKLEKTLTKNQRLEKKLHDLVYNKKFNQLSYQNMQDQSIKFKAIIQQYVQQIDDLQKLVEKQFTVHAKNNKLKNENVQLISIIREKKIQIEQYKYNKSELMDIKRSYNVLKKRYAKMKEELLDHKTQRSLLIRDKNNLIKQLQKEYYNDARYKNNFNVFDDINFGLY